MMSENAPVSRTETRVYYGLAVALTFVSAALAAYPIWRRLREAAVEKQEARLVDLREEQERASQARLEVIAAWLAQSEQAMKDYRRARIAIEALHESVDRELVAVEARTRDLHDDQIRQRALDDELRQLRGTREALERQLGGWSDSATAFFDYLQRLQQLLPPHDAQAALIGQIGDVFARYCEARGIDRIAPRPGDPVLPGLHQVIGEAPSAEFPAGVVFTCETWGYRQGAVVLKPARVVITRRATTLPGYFV